MSYPFIYEKFKEDRVIIKVDNLNSYSRHEQIIIALWLKNWIDNLNDDMCPLDYFKYEYTDFKLNDLYLTNKNLKINIYYRNLFGYIMISCGHGYNEINLTDYFKDEQGLFLITDHCEIPKIERLFRKKIKKNP